MREERGSTVAIVLILLPALIALAGLVIDSAVGVYYKLALQHAVDAASLAATAAYDKAAYEQDGSITISETDARPLAAHYLQANLADARLQSLTVDPDRPNRVKVEGTVRIPVFFMRILGVEPYWITAHATAARGVR